MKIYTTPSSAGAIKLTAKLVAEKNCSIDDKIYVFCESSSTLSFEKEIAVTSGGTFNVEVMSFSRYVKKHAHVEKYLTKAKAALLVRKLMKLNGDKLMRLKADCFSLPSAIYELISQLKAALVTPKDLYEVIESEGGAFGSKLKDIAVIYELYENEIKSLDITDENNYLSLMEGLIAEDTNLKGAKVFVAGIQSFTKQTLKIVKALAKCADVDFITVAFNAPAYTNEAVNKLSGIFNCEVIPVFDGIGADQLAIAKGLFDPSVFAGGGFFSPDVKITEAASLSDECNRVAARIRYEVVKNNRRYKDFTVVTGNLAGTVPQLKQAFTRYGIPLYADESKTLDVHPIIGLIGAFIDLKRFNLLPKKVLAFVKCGLVFSDAESETFTSYMLTNSISRSKMREPFDDMIAEPMRALIVSATDDLKTKDTVANYIEAIKKFLDDFNILIHGSDLSDKLNEYGEGVTAGFNDGALSALPILLDGVNEILGDVTCTLQEFKSIILSSSKAVKVSTVPEYNDTVFAGDFKSCRMRQSKILFAVGLNSDVPGYRADVSLLNDRELVKMDGYRLVIEPKLQIVNDRERENIAVSLMSFTDKIYLSYSAVNQSGEPTFKSEVIDYFIAIFSDENNRLVPYLSSGEEMTFSDEAAEYNYMSHSAGMIYAAKRAQDYREKKVDDITDVSSFLASYGDKTVTEDFLSDFCPSADLFNPDLSYSGKFSATAIENFFKCPYYAFAQNQLNLKEAETGDAKVFEIGNILHAVMEKLIKNYKSLNDDTNIVALAESIVDEELKNPLYARYLNKPEYTHIFRIIKNEAIKECAEVYNDIKNSEFVPIGAEIEFNESSPYGLKPIYIDTPNGTVIIRGKIDRADRCGEYFRIIDYKSGQASDNDQDFYTGTKIQLYLYTNVLKKKNLKPAGAYYLKLSDNFSKSDKHSEADPTVEFLGKTLADITVISKLDTTFMDSGKSKNLNVNINKSGELSLKSNTLSEREFAAYTDYAILVVKSGADEMKRGLFVPAPKAGACEYCNYRGMCGYDEETCDRTRDVADFGKDVIKNIIISAAGNDENG